MPIYTTREWFKKLPEPKLRLQSPKPEDTARFDARAWVAWFWIEREFMGWENELENDLEAQFWFWCQMQKFAGWKKYLVEEAWKKQRGKAYSTKLRGNVAWRGYEIDIG